MCHEIGRPHMRGLPDYQVPEIPTAMETILHMAQLVNRDVRFVGVSLNTSNVTPEDAAAFKKKTADLTGLPLVDPLKDGVRSEEHTSGVQSPTRHSYAVLLLTTTRKNKTIII